MSPAAELFLHFKETVSKQYVLELTIFRVEDRRRYPDGIKYSLIFIDPGSGEKVLMDNHHPKGHHIHLGELEMKYEYKNEDRLIADFKDFVFQHMGVRL